MISQHYPQKGLTLVELIIVMGIVAILFTITAGSISSIRPNTTNSTSISVISSDIKNQQIQAISGDTEGQGAQSNFGIKLLPNSYVLFRGDVYDPSEATNFEVEIATGHQLSSTFPDDTIIFASKSGEIINFSDGQDTVSLTNTTSGSSRTIELNKYGTIISNN